MIKWQIKQQSNFYMWSTELRREQDVLFDFIRKFVLTFPMRLDCIAWACYPMCPYKARLVDMMCMANNWKWKLIFDSSRTVHIIRFVVCVFFFNIPSHRFTLNSNLAFYSSEIISNKKENVESSANTWIKIWWNCCIQWGSNQTQCIGRRILSNINGCIERQHGWYDWLFHWIDFIFW